ncbi:hypothetical protein GCM10011591_10470 [Nocardia camponoti]|uniref:Uncharacterized protein n=1 Tax=Nocardia camponoti TaxID=1616106 RepID=A0A917QAX0_9NOCA|nr:hypothetical protein GCM10011591_10470 [Nocardia camponoti]
MPHTLISSIKSRRDSPNSHNQPARRRRVPLRRRNLRLKRATRRPVETRPTPRDRDLTFRIRDVNEAPVLLHHPNPRPRRPFVAPAHERPPRSLMTPADTVFLWSPRRPPRLASVSSADTVLLGHPRRSRRLTSTNPANTVFLRSPRRPPRPPSINPCSPAPQNAANRSGLRESRIIPTKHPRHRHGRQRQRVAKLIVRSPPTLKRRLSGGSTRILLRPSEFRESSSPLSCLPHLPTTRTPARPHRSTIGPVKRIQSRT